MDILFRAMVAEDIERLSALFCFPWSSENATREKWEGYYKEQQKKSRAVVLVEKENTLIGYGSLLLESKYPHFSKIPEIHDVWVDENHRRHGFGTQLISYLEGLASQRGYKQVGIGVGLYRDYGPAQTLYFHLGYVPDGHGITYKYNPVTPGESYPVDDDLVIWLLKTLS